MRCGGVLMPEGGAGNGRKRGSGGRGGRREGKTGRGRAGEGGGRTAAPHCILVDQSGVRYMSEGGSYMAYCKGMLERNKSVPAVPSWAVFDAQFLRDYMFAGTMPSAKKPRRWFDEGYLRHANSVDELARLLKMKPETLRATVDRFNGFVAKNCDQDFHRGD